MLHFLKRFNINYQELRNKYLPTAKTLIRFAFSSRRRKMGTILYGINGEDSMRLHEKGSPETILYSCKEIHSADVKFTF